MGNKSMIRLDTAYEVRHESFEEFKDSFFKDVYDNASLMVREIVVKNRGIQGGLSDKNRRVEQICNVVALMGQRGSGKSSALSSYCGFLSDFYGICAVEENVQTKKQMDNVRRLIKLGEDNKISFTVLDIIDATLLESDENIIEIILGRMLDKLEAREEEIHREDWNAGKSQNNHLKKIIGDIYKVMHNKPDKEFDMDEPAVITLKAMSKSWNLRREFQNLVYEYINYLHMYGKGREQGANDNYLVIPIDDIDMNVGKCREMLEMIRKYLMVPQVIILTTFNYEQLTTVCRNHYHKELRLEYMQNESITELEQKEIDNLAKEYLEQVIPTGRKIYMPGLYYTEGFIEKNMVVSGLETEYFKKDFSICIRELISALLRLYTGVVCLSGDYENHLLYPVSIRKLCNYVKEFRQLQMVPMESSDGRKNYQHNLNWLYDDIMKRFLYQNVMGEGSYLVKEFLDITADQKMNYLARKAKMKYEALSEKGEVLAELSKFIAEEEKKNITSSIYLLSLIEREEIYSKDALLCLQMYFSIMMVRLYFEKKYGEEEEQKKAEEYWQGNWWPEWEKEIFMKMNAQQGNESTEEQGTGKFGRQENIPMEGWMEIVVISVDEKELADNVKVYQIADAVMMYQIVRFFVESKKGKIEFLGDDDVKKSIGIYTSNRGFSLFNLFKNISEYEVFFADVEQEIKEQLDKQNVKYDDDIFGLKREFEEWFHKYQMKYIAPFYSAEWMMEVLSDFSDTATQKQTLGDMIMHMVNVFEGKTKMLDGACIAEQLKESDKWDPICVCKYSEVFRECPIIKIIKESGEVYNEAVNKIAEIQKWIWVKDDPETKRD